jgi:hypothetical protein
MDETSRKREGELAKAIRKKLAAEQRTTQNTIIFTQNDTRDARVSKSSGHLQRVLLRFVIYTYTRQALLPRIRNQESQNLHLCYDS